MVNTLEYWELMKSTLPMARHVGIVYGSNDKPLYCHEDGKYWHVINGGWSFAKDNDTIPYGNHPRPKWKIILRNMKGGMEYREACWMITEKAKKLNERKNLRI